MDGGDVTCWFVTFTRPVPGEVSGHLRPINKQFNTYTYSLQLSLHLYLIVHTMHAPDTETVAY